MSGDIIKNIQTADFKNTDLSDLKDISQIKIDEGEPLNLRIFKFINQVGSPYMFRVGNTPVKVVFSKKYAQVSIETELAKIVSGNGS